MSADLFAAFNNDTSQGSSQAKQQSSRPTATGAFSPPSADPFSFLAPSAPPAQAKQSYQAPQWQQPQWQQSQWQQPQAPSWNPPQQWAPQGQQAGIAWGSASAPKEQVSNPTKPGGEEEDDGWGDFEVATPQSTSFAAVPSALPGSSGGSSGSTASPSNTPGAALPRPRTMRASTLSLVTNSLVDIGGLAQKEGGSPQGALPERPREKVRQPQPADKDPNVLFDADDFDGQPLEDDEFGDFETVEEPPPPRSSAPAAQPVADLLSSSASFASSSTSNNTTRKAPPSQLLSSLIPEDSEEPVSRYPNPPRTPSFHQRNPFPGLGVATPKTTEFSPRQPAAASPSPATAWPSFDEKAGVGTGTTQRRNSLEDWGTFEDLPANSTKSKAPRTTAKPTKPTNPTPAPQSSTRSDWDWDAWEGGGEGGAGRGAAGIPEPAAVEKTAQTDEPGPPPTNVPPPSILLSLFPQLLGSANTYLFKPTSGQPASVKERVLSDPAAARFLRGYLALATVAGRIMAGRKLRWQRDKFLSQGMAISAAAAPGGKRGMKLSGVDRAQAGHEDREAADVAAAWKALVGRLRSAVAAANSGEEEKSRLRVPELADGLAVRTAKGALTAPRACVVCGLRRDERVAKLDFEVEDSFGEWWVEFWGHRACRNFWLEHEARLRQR